MSYFFKSFTLIFIVLFATFFINKRLSTAVPKEPTVDVELNTPPEKTQGKTFEVKQLVLDKKRTYEFTTDVNKDSVEELIKFIRKMNEESQTKPIFILLDSPGGSVFHGKKLLGFMEGSKAPIHTVVTGTCASMCGFIFEYGARRDMTTQSTLMFHPASAKIAGTVEELKSFVDFLFLTSKQLDEFVAKRAGIDPVLFKLLVRDELWLTPESAIQLRLADNLVHIQ